MSSRSWSVVARVRAAGRTPVDIASLAALRIIFGTVMFAGIVRFLATGWIEPMYGEPRWFFTYPGFGWVEPWSTAGMYVHYAVLAALALAIAIGAFYRIAIVLFTVGFAYTQLIDITNYLNHHYLVVLVGGLLACLPAHAAWSVDARRRPALRRATIPAWVVWLLRFQIGVVYVFAGLAKAKLDWLGDGQPLNLWLAARTETPVVGALFADPWVAHAMSWAGFVFDTTIVVWLSWRRTRLVAYACLVAFHGLTGYLFNIGMFPLIMTSAALIFFAPSWPRRLLAVARRLADALVGRAPPSADASPSEVEGEGARAEAIAAPSERVPAWLRRVAAIAITVHVTLQLALPLRHLVYPGDVLWNEDGMRFAWHVMIREKHGSVTYVARFADGRQLEVPPGKFLTPRQERELGGQPDLILQLAHHVGDTLHAQGLRDFTLHARTAVSLNGRRPQAMIDPAVDLLTIRDAGPRTWVLPAPTSAPAQVRGVRSSN